MIKEALEYVVEDLNDHFRRVLDPRPVKDLAVLSVIVDQQGEVAVKEENAIIFSVLSIQEEKKSGATNGRGERRAPIDLNLYVLVSGYFPGQLTGDALQLISIAIEFFYDKNVFLPSNSPGLSTGIHRMSWEIYNMDFTEQSNLWSAIGAKHMPSVIYRVRLQLVPGTRQRISAPRITERGAQLEA
ncbi:MAG: DUF4255 domain-containing protein [Bacteroidota bacterium]